MKVRVPRVKCNVRPQRWYRIDFVSIDATRDRKRTAARSALPPFGSQPPSQVQWMAASAGCIAAFYQQVNDQFGPAPD